jgi:very-short-patch-repair endonuclease
VCICRPDCFRHQQAPHLHREFLGSCAGFFHSTRAGLAAAAVFGAVDADRAGIALARGQQALITRAQLLDVGHTDDAIRHRVRKGWLRRLYRGVYLVGALETAYSQPMGAVLAYGEGALLSHDAAAALWGVRAAPATTMHVTVAGRDVRSRDGIRAHVVRALDPADVRRRHGIPVTSPARTLLDLATMLPARELDRAVNEARVHRLVTDDSLNEQFKRYPTHRGVSALKAASRPDPAFTRSEAERRLLELIRAARLPQPETNVRVVGHEVDLLWRAERLVVEVDGYAFHSSRVAFERDRRRDAELGVHDYRVLRVTWRQIAEEPEALIALPAATLAAQARPSARARSSIVSA